METQRGTKFFMEIDLVTPTDGERPDGTDYKLLACSISDGLDIAVASETTSNKCSDGNQESQPGEFSWTMNTDGQVTSLSETEAETRENNQTLKNLIKNKTKFWLRRADALLTPEGYAEGVVWISGYNDTAPNNEVFTFNATFQGTGELFTEPATT